MTTLGFEESYVYIYKASGCHNQPSCSMHLYNIYLGIKRAPTQVRQGLYNIRYRYLEPYGNPKLQPFKPSHYFERPLISHFWGLPSLVPPQTPPGQGLVSGLAMSSVCGPSGFQWAWASRARVWGLEALQLWLGLFYRNVGQS